MEIERIATDLTVAWIARTPGRHDLNEAGAEALAKFYAHLLSSLQETLEEERPSA